jgi:hypothetical protein
MKLRVPHPLWILSAAVVLVVGTVGLRVGIPIYSQQQVIRAVEDCGGSVSGESRGPEWLRNVVGAERMRGFDTVTAVEFDRCALNEHVLRN